MRRHFFVLSEGAIIEEQAAFGGHASSLKMTQAACTIGITLGVMTVNLKLTGPLLQATSSSPKPFRVAIKQITAPKEEKSMNYSQRKRCTNQTTDCHSQVARNVIYYIKSMLLSSLKMTQAACTIGITLGVMTVNLKLIITGYAASAKPTRGVIGE